jgi:hypothetical protein
MYLNEEIAMKAITTTTTATAAPILALDLGRYKSVACV